MLKGEGTCQVPQEKCYYNCDLNEVLTGVYIGDEHAAGNKELLKGLEIKHILVTGKQLKMPYKKDFNYLHISVRDHRKEPILEYFNETNEFIQMALDRKQAILVHCAMGKSRSVAFVLAYIMKRYRRSFEDSLMMIKRKRKEANPNEGFVYQLKKYGEQLKKESSMGKNES